MIAADLLLRLPIFKDVPKDVLSTLASYAHIQTLETDDIIVHQHDDAQAAYFLLSGAVQFLIRFQGADDMLVGTTAEFGAPIGWSIAREPHRYTATVRCESRCELIQMPRSILDRVIEENPAIGYEILRHLAVAVATRLEQARNFLVTPTVT